MFHCIHLRLCALINNFKNKRSLQAGKSKFVCVLDCTRSETSIVKFGEKTKMCVWRPLTLLQPTFTLILARFYIKFERTTNAFDS